MAAGISGFRTEEQRRTFESVYDRLLDEHWPVPHDELDVDTRFGPTRVRRSLGGTATPLVMLHPHAGSSVGWYPLIERLCHGRDVFTPDTMGGAGRSVQHRPITSVGDLVVWLDEVMDLLGLDRVHLLGYSEGGWIAANLAAATGRSQRLASVTLVEPAGAIAKIPSASSSRWRGAGWWPWRLATGPRPSHGSTGG